MHYTVTPHPSVCLVCPMPVLCTDRADTLLCRCDVSLVATGCQPVYILSEKAAVISAVTGRHTCCLVNCLPLHLLAYWLQIYVLHV